MRWLRPAPLRSELSTRQYGWALATVALAVLPYLGWLVADVVLLPLGLVGLAWWWSRRKGEVRLLPGWLRLLLIALLCALIVGRYGGLLGRLAGASLLVAMLALKATECRRPRDVRVMVGIAFFVVVAAFLFNDSPLLVLYMLFVTGFGFAAMEALEQRDGEHSLLFARLGWRQVLTLMLVSLPLVVVLWLFFPRVSTPFWGTPEQAGRTGLSDTMRPGDITELLSDDKPVLRVTFDGPLPGRDQLYFRGPTLWFYDGESWRGSEFVRHTRREFAIRADLRYTVYQEATERRWLFALDRPVSVGIDARWTNDRQLLAEQPLVGAVEYAVSSQLQPPYARERLSGSARQAALQLPAAFNPRTLDLARALRAQAGSDDRRIVQTILQRFTTEPFEYSLQPPPLGRHRIDEFLFDTRSGFCEHYAAAFVGLLRASGVPARVVTGYLGGVYNASGGYLTVRNSDAHAWAEVWLDGDWERFDPTAAIAPERVSVEGGAALQAETGFWAGLGQRIDALGQAWRSFVVQFNALRQMDLLKPFGIDKADWQHLGMALAVLGGLAAAFAAWFLWRHRPVLTRDPWQRGWFELARKLAHAGLPVAAMEGPHRLRQRVAHWRHPAAPRILALLHQFETAQYIDPAPVPAQGRHFRRQVRRLRLRRLR